MSLRRQLSKSLLSRVLTANFIQVSALTIALSSVFLVAERSSFQRQQFLRAQTVLDLTAVQCEFAMLVGDKLQLEDIAARTLNSEDVLSVMLSEIRGVAPIVANRPGTPSMQLPIPHPDGTAAEMRYIMIGGNRVLEMSRAVTRPASGLMDLVPEKGGSAPLGTVRIGFSMQRQNEFFADSLKRALAVAMVSLLGIFAVQYLQVHRLLKPLRTLAELTRQIGAGKLDCRMPVTRDDEVGKLAIAFNQMTEKLGETTVSRDHMDNILRSMSESLVVVGPDQRVRMVNQATLELVGYSEAELLDRPLDFILPSRSAARQPDLDNGVRRGGLEGEYRDREDRRIPVSLSFGKLRGNAGAPEGTVWLAQDVTERKRAERELLVAKEAAESANRAKSAFLANMSHEIRTPLNAVLGYSQLMLRDPALGLDAKRNLSIINSSGEHLLALLNDILDMSKIEAGRVKLNTGAFDLPALVRDLAAMFRLRASTKGLDFEVVEGDELTQYISADEGKIRQVLINLMGNAVKFTERGGVKLYVSTASRQEDQLWLSVRVQDTGIGIAPEDLARLFRAFAQAQNGMQAQGTGLGLAISREYARLMGGDIQVNSEPGKGATFQLEIPVAHGEGNAVARRTPQGSWKRVRPGEVKRLLVVDDEPHNRGWVCQLLTSVGFSVREAENGAVAVRMSEDWRPHLIFMDMRMPVMDGIEATRRIRANPAAGRPVIIALTASALDDDRRVAMQCGVDNFVSKPCHEQELLEKIGTHLQVSYESAEPQAVPNPEPAVAFTSPVRAERLRKLPVNWIEELEDATRNGEKDRLDEVISRFTGQDDAVASALQQLANNYEYDVLAELCREARQ